MGNIFADTEIDRNLLRKKSNFSRILDLLRKQGALSKLDIAKLTRMNTSSVGTLVDELIREGYINEIGPGSSTGGRRPVLLELNPHACYIIGVDFEATSIMAVLVNFGAQIIKERKASINPKDDKLTIVRKINDTIRSVIEKDKEKIIGIGVGVPGIVDTKKGIGLYYNGLPNWKDVPIRDFIQMEFSLPTYLEKNIRSMALAERYFGVGKNYNNFICLGVRSGMALGIIIDGKLYKGSSETAGEIAHFVVESNGPKCQCGQKGCLQIYSSGKGILERIRKAKGELKDISIKNKIEKEKSVSLWEIVRAARNGDRLCQGLLKEAMQYIGKAVAEIVDVINPELIIVAGGLTLAGKEYFTLMEEEIKRKSVNMATRALRIEKSQLGEYAGAYGAAAAVLMEKVGAPY